jgi:hypothetical protein
MMTTTNTTSHPRNINVDDETPSAHCAPVVLAVREAGVIRGTDDRDDNEEDERSWIGTVPSTTASQQHDDEEDDNNNNNEMERREIKPPPTTDGRRRLLGTWILLMVINLAAVLSSILTNLSCRFFSLAEDLPNTVDLPLLDIIPSNATSVGLFGYSSLLTTVDESPSLLTYYKDYIQPHSSCRSYDDTTPFWDSPDGGRPFLMVAQWAAVLAPCFGGMALMVQLVEAVMGAYQSTMTNTTTTTPKKGSLIFALLGLAMLLQGVTFCIYGDTSFW